MERDCSRLDCTLYHCIHLIQRQGREFFFFFFLRCNRKDANQGNYRLLHLSGKTKRKRREKKRDRRREQEDYRRVLHEAHRLSAPSQEEEEEEDMALCEKSPPIKACLVYVQSRLTTSCCGVRVEDNSQRARRIQERENLSRKLAMLLNRIENS